LSACSSGEKRLPRGLDYSFEGTWQGRTVNSQELTTKINLFVFQHDKGLKGSYRCAFGSTACLNGNLDGTLNADFGSTKFQVTLQDTSRCEFSGDFTEQHAFGTYICYSTGVLIDHGSWELKRVDALQN
jgi:hypothetical protein